MITGQQASISFSRAQWLGYASLCLIWGSTWLAIRVSVHDIPPLEAAAIRFLAAGGLLIIVALLQKRRWPRDARQWNAILVLSLTIMALPYGLLFWAEQHVASSMTAVLFSAMPLAVSLFTPAMMHRKVPRQAVYAMVIGFGGLLSLFYSGELKASERSLISGVAVLASMTLSAWSVVYAKLRLREVDSVVSTGLQLLFGSLVLLWGTWALEAHRHAVWTRPALLAMAFLTLFGSAAAFVIYYWLLKRFQPYQLSTISLIVPLIALFEGWLAGEAIHLMMVIAVIVVLGSVRSVLRAEAEKPVEGDLLMLRDRVQ
ncbi:MAG TPA: EamA family transporter [Candidatus Angelobacter sp.]|nr:EamA family transporter [Candidatus Angelobacter sp.]